MKRERVVTPFLTIREILRDRQPGLYYPLTFLMDELPDITYGRLREQAVLAASWLTDRQKKIARIMEEPPRPGRGADDR